MAITLADIAKKAQVSKATASAVLGDRGPACNVRVGQATRERIRQIAEEMGFQRNNLAAGLRKGKTNVIGLVTPVVMVDFVMRAINAIDAAADKRGYRLHMSQDLGRGEDSADKIVGEMRSNQVDGLILFLGHGSEDYLEEIEKRNYPHVIIHGQTNDRLYSVTLDDEYSGVAAVRHMADIGRRKPVFLATGPDPISVGTRRFLDGWRVGCEEARIDFDTCPLVWVPHSDLGDGREACRIFDSFLESEPDFDCVVARYDHFALAAMRALSRKGISVPGEVAVMGYGDSSFSRTLPVSLTTIAQPVPLWAETAVDYLVAQIEGTGPSVKSRNLRGRVEARESTLVADQSQGPVL